MDRISWLNSGIGIDYSVLCLTNDNCVFVRLYIIFLSLVSPIIKNGFGFESDSI